MDTLENILDGYQCFAGSPAHIVNIDQNNHRPKPKKKSRPPQSFQKTHYATSRNLLNGPYTCGIPLESSMLPLALHYGTVSTFGWCEEAGRLYHPYSSQLSSH
jgi:hypothetical protein